MTELSPFRVGLTGGIASGKSLAADLFAGRGAIVIDTDLIARGVVAPGTRGLAAITEAFGPEFVLPDGNVNRKALRQTIFDDPAARARLEAITHPLIREATLAQARLAGGPYQIIAVPLLAETGFKDIVDRVLVVDCPQEIQLQRLMKRDNESQESAKKILAAQASRAERLAIADDVIVNDGTIAQLEEKVTQLHNRYLSLASARTPTAGKS
ncbi:MAG: dephospho-CoA kinase [Gammaproteobacteria bacterium]|jgi:dephospho-CoA kinase